MLNTHVRDNLNALQVVTTKGDIAVATASVTLTRLAVGTNGAVLVADSAATPGVRWSSTGKTASAGSVLNIDLTTTMTAAANGDTFYTVYMSPVFASGTKTGLTAYGVFVDGAAFTKTGTGTIDTVYALFLTAPTIGTLNITARFDGKIFISDNSNANMTIGLTVNQGAADDEILALKSSDVAHGMTTQLETDTYGNFKKYGAASGGLAVIGASSDVTGLILRGYYTTGTTTKSTAGVAAIILDVGKKSGTTVGAAAANENLVAISDGTSIRFIFDADGDSHEDVGTLWTNFDAYDDIALLNLLAAKLTHKDDPIRHNFGKWLRENRKQLEDLKLITFNRDGHHFINRSRTQELLIGAMRQVGAKLEAQAERLLLLEKKVLQLTA